MRLSKIFLVLVFCCAAGAAATAQVTDPLAELKQFGGFQKIDVKRMLEGEILSQRGALMKFPNGISSQLCFAVPLSPSETVKQLETWDSKRYAALKVYASHELRDPVDPDEFNDLYRYLDPGTAPLRWFWDQTLATTPRSSDLNLTQIEASELSRCVGKNADVKTIASCWGNLLHGRASSFQRNGFSKALTYDFDVEPINPASHLRALLQEQAPIAREFAPLLQSAGLLDGGGAIPPSKPTCYWRLFQADHHATLSLGAVYLRQVGDHYQLLDLEYYVSGTYYTSATLYEIWPVREGGRAGSLVWCNVFCSAPTLRFASGIERLASGVILTLEFKKVVRCFQDSVKPR
ncbi:hypothetical protein [Geomonas sp.]|uniref:hypothetical protein n=1 Tax=Geomonas sp. TaxID=2651584 RepID=UPI002B46E5B8|nr:hypothetical protein [Geomonas sp.]HJV35282.1 hypothetical protein [Geomonas sp.]